MRTVNHRPAWACLAAALALGSLAALPSGAAAAAPAPDPTPAATPRLLDAMRRDLHLSDAGVRERLADESAANLAAARIRARAGDRIPGLWFDAAAGRLTAAVTTDADEALVRAAGAVPVRVGHTGARLDATTKAITRQVGAGIDGVVSWGPDVRNNRVDVTVDRAASTASTELFVAAVDALGPIAHVTYTSDTPVQQSDVIGGEKWTPGSESPCSIGFPVTRTSGGTKAFLTAGHCTNDTNQPAYGKDGTRVGTSNRNGSGSVNAREGDMGIVDVDQSGWNVVPTVAGYGQGDITVTGSADAIVGTAICRSGQTTGLRCGEVTKVDQSVDYGNVVIEGLSYSSACSAGGDSGGAYVTAAGGKAIGLHSGGGSATCSSGSGEKFTIFQPVNEALSRFGATLVTATPQPGDVTVTPVPARSTAIGTPVELKNTATGGAAPYTWTAGGLPAGLTIAATTGTVTGAPTTAGTSNVTVTATDTAGRKASASFTWTVTAVGGGAPVLRNPGNQIAYVNKPVSLPIQATGGTRPYRWTADGLPAGLSLDTATGTVTGAPTTWGMRTSRIALTDAAGRTATTDITWNVYF
ncbi:putative Ig domain-containing protein [Streptomyces sp. NPDC102278]|uniref:putative Ig domain-containing protein n=1 Tax=Streptomyces sp. NPDC102278 TaxID=3366152 RepID=UPI00380B9A6B